METILEYVMSIESTILILGVTGLCIIGIISFGSKTVDQQLLAILEREEFEKEVDRVVRKNIEESSVDELLKRICQLRDSECPVVLSTMSVDLSTMESELRYRLDIPGDEIVQATQDSINIRLYFDDPENFQI